jgi:DNA polymerase III epsilon subunit-like protein
MANTLVFDLETTGLPITKSFNKYHQYNKLAYYNDSRIIEIGYIVFDSYNIEIKRKEFLIKLPNISITNSHIHGIIDDMCNNGSNINDVLDEFENDLTVDMILVAHNILFDINVLLSECYRYNKHRLINKIKHLNYACTMDLAMKKLNFIHHPKLIILYQYLSGKKVIQDHRALSDVLLCSYCFFKIINL